MDPASEDEESASPDREHLIALARGYLLEEIGAFRAGFQVPGRGTRIFEEALPESGREVGAFGPFFRSDFPFSDDEDAWAIANGIGHLVSNAETFDLLSATESTKLQVLERILEEGPRDPGMAIALPLEYTLRRLGAGELLLTQVTDQELRGIWIQAVRSYAEAQHERSVLYNGFRRAAARAGLEEEPTAEDQWLICPTLNEVDARLEAYESQFLADLHSVLAGLR
ncbi:MAG: hypothetical protein H8E31_05070 [Planctomycetes bacterium]|nr:hypothetical protein [Planctomycetota bacterium]